MFVLRSLFWLTTVVVLLPASPDAGDPAPRVNLVHTAYAVRAIVEDVSGVCARNPDACTATHEALTLLGQKIETGAGIVAATVKAGRNITDDSADHGTLTAADLEPEWSATVAIR